MNTIHKAGGILIQNRKLLVEKSFGKPWFLAPGGKAEGDETPQQTLVRELREEFGITVAETDLTPFETFTEQAEGMPPGVRIVMDVFLVNRWNGDPQPTSEVEKILWIDSAIPSGVVVGSIMQHHIIPQLKAKGLID